MRRIGVDWTSPDFAELARAFGGCGISTDLDGLEGAVDGLEGAVADALDRDVPTITELKRWTR